MSRVLLPFFRSLILGIYLSLSLVAQETGNSLVLTGVTVIDCTGAPEMPDMTVVIKNDRIAAMGKSADVAIPQDATIVDAKHKYLIPGLWDMHVHVRPYESPLFIANGVTAVRIMFGRSRDVVAREQVRERQAYIPDRFVASAPIADESFDIRNDRDVIQVTNKPEAREAVQAVSDAGFDSVKISSRLRSDLYNAIADEAQRIGIPFAGHVPDSVSAEFASEKGQKSIEHLTGISIGCSRHANGLQELFSQTKGGGKKRGDILIRARETYDEKVAQRLFEKFVSNGTWQCPTLTLYHARSRAADSSLFQDARLQFIPSWESNRWNRDLKAMATYARDPDIKFQHYLRLVGEMHKAGVKILAGTDTANPYCFQGFGIHDELELLVRAGLSPFAALQTATRNPAEYVGRLHDFGTIENGKIADLVLLENNPLEDINNTRQIIGVVLRGHWRPNTDLQRLLAQAKLTAKIENIGGRVKRDPTKAHQPIVEVRFSNRRLTDQQVSQVQDLTELQHLSLSNSQITDDCLTTIGRLRHLQQLYLVNTKISDAGLASLVNLSELQQLWLGSTKITNQGLRKIATLARLQKLGLANTEVNDEGIRNLKALSELTELYLGGTNVSDTGLEQLAAMNGLRVLVLRDTHASDSGLAKLANLTKLERLVLTATRISDASLHNIAKLQNLRILDLSHTQVSDSGLKHLSGLSKLRQLSLEGTRVSESGINALHRDLPSLQVNYSPYGKFEVVAAQSADDAEELSNGMMHVDSFDLELVQDQGLRIVGAGKQVIGMRFGKVNIRRNALLKKAFIQFTAKEVSEDEASLTIQAELSENPDPFRWTNGNITERSTTPISVKWSPPPWNSVGDNGPNQQTPDLTPLISAVMNQAGWRRGNALVFIIKGSGRRVAETYDSQPSAAPTLYIEYEN